MTQTDTAGKGRRANRAAALAVLFALLSLASPGVASSMASNAGGADKSRPATFGDCKNQNAGVHNGYDCEAEEASGAASAS